MQKIDYANDAPFINHFNQLNEPILLMSFPFHISNQYPNNPLMQTYKKKKLNRMLAYAQFLNFYKKISNDALVYLMPAGAAFQDLCFVANIAWMVPQHLKENTILLSNFRSKPRLGEEIIGAQFFSLMGLNVIRVPYFFEGEADLKLINNHFAIGAYGIRTDIQAHRWIEKQTHLKILSLELQDPKLYHLDCCAFVLNHENILLYRKAFHPKELLMLEKKINIVDINVYDDILAGSCNSFKIHSKVYHSSNLLGMSKKDKNYQFEKKRIECLNKILQHHALSLELIDLSEFQKSGAGISCLLMHMNLPQ